MIERYEKNDAVEAADAADRIGFATGEIPWLMNMPGYFDALRTAANASWWSSRAHYAFLDKCVEEAVRVAEQRLRDVTGDMYDAPDTSLPVAASDNALVRRSSVAIRRDAQYTSDMTAIRKHIKESYYQDFELAIQAARKNAKVNERAQRERTRRMRIANRPEWLRACIEFAHSVEPAVARQRGRAIMVCAALVCVVVMYVAWPWLIPEFALYSTHTDTHGRTSTQVLASMTPLVAGDARIEWLRAPDRAWVAASPDEAMDGYVEVDLGWRTRANVSLTMLYSALGAAGGEGRCVCGAHLGVPVVAARLPSGVVTLGAEVTEALWGDERVSITDVFGAREHMVPSKALVHYMHDHGSSSEQRMSAASVACVVHCASPPR